MFFQANFNSLWAKSLLVDVVLSELMDWPASYKTKTKKLVFVTHVCEKQIYVLA